MIVFVDDIQNLDQDAPIDSYQMMILSVTEVDGPKLTMNDGSSEFELAFQVIGDEPEINRHYYCLIDVENNLLYMKELEEEPKRDVVKQFMALCHKNVKVFN